MPNFYSALPGMVSPYLADIKGYIQMMAGTLTCTTVIVQFTKATGER